MATGQGRAARVSRHVTLPAVAAWLAAALTALRLTRRISWPWWLVLSPLWALAGIVALLFAGIVATAAIDSHATARERRRHAGL